MVGKRTFPWRGLSKLAKIDVMHVELYGNVREAYARFADSDLVGGLHPRENEQCLQELNGAIYEYETKVPEAIRRHRLPDISTFKVKRRAVSPSS